MLTRNCFWLLLLEILCFYFDIGSNIDCFEISIGVITFFNETVKSVFRKFHLERSETLSGEQQHCPWLKIQEIVKSQVSSITNHRSRQILFPQAADLNLLGSLPVNICFTLFSFAHIIKFSMCQPVAGNFHSSLRLLTSPAGITRSCDI